MLGHAAGRSGHGRRMVAADVEKGAEFVIRATHDDERFPGQIECKKLPCGGRPVRSPDGDPIAAKTLPVLQARDALVNVPGRRNGVRHFKRRVLIVKRQNVFDGGIHGVPSSKGSLTAGQIGATMLAGWETFLQEHTLTPGPGSSGESNETPTRTCQTSAHRRRGYAALRRARL